MTLRRLSPAKINLYLAVTGKRSDGYHDIRTLMCPVGLWDHLTMVPVKGITTVHCNHPLVPQNETNLAHRAALLFFDSVTSSSAPGFAGVRIEIEKRIPVAAGLGGGSSNAATVLAGLNRYFGSPFTTERLSQMALQLGADVPFFLLGTPALATGVGERLQKTGNLPAWYALMVCQPFGVSTGAVYAGMKMGLTNCEKKIKGLHLDFSEPEIFQYLCNDLEMVTATRYPVIEEVKAVLIRHGAMGALMSGSGPTVFGLFPNATSAHRAAQKIAATSSSQAGGWELHVAALLT